jgi:hypothetical protein
MILVVAFLFVIIVAGLGFALAPAVGTRSRVPFPVARRVRTRNPANAGHHHLSHW